ncbi:MAG: glycosyltransferase [Cyclobacteriaceae bacterium]|nr:glycosyltransferase [Cyclobacteriaceae bacterium]
MRVLLVSISAPPQNTPESLQVIKYANHLAKRCELTVLTIKVAHGWRSADPGLYDAIKPATFIRLPHYSSRAGRFLTSIINKDWLMKPDEDFMFPRQWKKAIKKIGLRPDIIYSRATPFSSALMALKLKQHYKVPWVLHLSDPWLLSPLHLFAGKVREFHGVMERECFENADVVTLTSHEQIKLYTEHYPQFAHKFQFFPNVYNDDELAENPFAFGDKMIFLHTGNFYGEGRNPVFLLEAIKKITQQEPDFFSKCEFVFMGRLNPDVRAVFHQYNYPFVKVVEEYTFEESVSSQRKAHVLLLFDWRFSDADSVFFLSKILGYMTSQRPILAITGANSTCRSVIERRYGNCFVHDDVNAIAEYLRRAVINYKEKNMSFFSVAPADPAYSAQFNADRLYTLLSSLVYVPSPA